MPSVSKYALRFQNRLISFNQDVELMNILCTANKKGNLLPDDDKLFMYVDAQKHPALSGCKNTSTSKKIVVNHLRQTVYSAYIKDIYEELTEYVKGLLYEATLLSKDKTKAERLLGEHTVKFSAVDILKYDSLESLFMKISEDIMQVLESERSTKSLVTKVCNKVGLNIDRTKLGNALPFLELRHKLVHADGVADVKFQKKYSQFSYDGKGHIILNYLLIVNARRYISDLVLAIDAEAVKKGILEQNTP